MMKSFYYFIVEEVSWNDNGMFVQVKQGYIGLKVFFDLVWIVIY